MLEWIVDVSTKGVLNMNIHKYFTLTKMNIFDDHARFALKWQPLIGASTLTWAPNTTKNDTFQFDKFLHIQIISKLHSSCLYEKISILAWCLYLFWLWMNELGGFNVGKKSSINQGWVAWELRGLANLDMFSTYRLLSCLNSMGGSNDTLLIHLDFMGDMWILSECLYVMLLKYDGKVINLCFDVKSIYLNVE